MTRATLAPMSPARMVAALAAALCFGSIVASLADTGEPSPSAVVSAIVAIAGALAIAALLTVPVVAVQALRRGSSARPSRRVLATALVAGGLVTFPVYTNFYDDASLAAQGGGVGYCGGILPLAQVVRNSVADEPYGRIYYFASCDD
jgi:hypothetical protein